MDSRDETRKMRQEKSSPGSPLFLTGVDSDSDSSPSSSCEDMTRLVKHDASIEQSPKIIHPEQQLENMPPAEKAPFCQTQSNIPSTRFVDDVDTEEQAEEAAQWKYLTEPQTNDQPLCIDPRDVQTPDK